MNGISSLCGVGLRHRRDRIDRRDRGEPRIGVLRRGARQHQHRDEMHDAAEQRARRAATAASGSWQLSDSHEHDCTTAGIGASRAARVATPTGVS